MRVIPALVEQLAREKEEAPTVVVLDAVTVRRRTNLSPSASTNGPFRIDYLAKSIGSDHGHRATVTHPKRGRPLESRREALPAARAGLQLSER
jgi:hypothetical protein